MASTIKIVDGDFAVNAATGGIVTLTGIDKLKQDLDEFFTIYIQASGFGSGLEQLIGSVETNDIVVSLADRQIRSGIAEFINIQRADSLTYRSADERILGISYIQVKNDTADPTKYYFLVDIKTESGKSVSLTKTL